MLLRHVQTANRRVFVFKQQGNELAQFARKEKRKKREKKKEKEKKTSWL
jgi:hypothetical protein